MDAEGSPVTEEEDEDDMEDDGEGEDEVDEELITLLREVGIGEGEEALPTTPILFEA